MDRIKTGVKGLDDRMQGGIPKNSTIAVIGTFGTGKSTLGMQFLYEGLKKGENSIFISLDDGEDNLIATAEQFGWDFKKYVEEETLLLMKLSAIDIKTSLLRIRSELPRLFELFGTKRCVFDSITLFELLFKDENERRLIVYDLTQIIKSSGATSIITSETDKLNTHASRFGMIEYVTDGVLFMNYQRCVNERTVKLSIEITKMRRTKHSRDIMTYEINDHGLEVIE